VNTGKTSTTCGIWSTTSNYSDEKFSSNRELKSMITNIFMIAWFVVLCTVSENPDRVFLGFSQILEEGPDPLKFILNLINP
jgi:hypothetical protein